MIIDAVLFAGLLLWAIMGYMSGALKQIFRLIVVIAAYFAARPVSEMFVNDVVKFTGFPFDLSKALALMGAWFILALILSIISSFIIRKLFDLGGNELKNIDAIGGILLSSLKYITIVYLVFAAVLSYKTLIKRKFPEFYKKIDQSNIAGFIENNNMLKNVGSIKYSSRLSEISLYPSVMQKIGNDCYKMHQAKVAPPFCYKLLKLSSAKNKKGRINPLSKEFRNILQDKSFQKYITGKKVGYWLKKAKNGKLLKKAAKND